jgi:hypothetical protein
MIFTRRSLAGIGGLITGAAAASAAAQPAIAERNASFGDPAARSGGEPYRAIEVSRARIPAAVRMVRTTGYYQEGDGGGADYVRVAAEPAHPGKLRDGLGGWWELRETVVNPIMFGAVMDGATPADDAFNDLSAYVAAVRNVAEIRLAANTSAMGSGDENAYLLRKGWVLPTFRYHGGTPSPRLRVNGHGVALKTDARIIEVISRLPTAQRAGPGLENAEVIIDLNKFTLEGITVVGTGLEGQTGFAIGATYGMQVLGCLAIALGKGFVANFCLQSYWENCATANCRSGGFYLQDGTGDGLGGYGWEGATTSNSQSNVSVLQNCRVYGAPTQTQAFYLYASDSCALRNCVAEGNGGAVDLRFDYGGSTTVKLFTVEGLHFENPNNKCLMRIRATGVVKIKGIFYQYPAAILDPSGSISARFAFEDIPYTPGAREDAANRNNRLFFHTDGNGHGARSEPASAHSNGSSYEFRNLGFAPSVVTNAASWESGSLPFALAVFTGGDSGGGVREFKSNFMLAGIPGGSMSINQHFLPAADNAQNIGSGRQRFAQVYASAGVISTSDERTKTSVRPPTDREAAAGLALLQEIGLYRFLSSLAEKGEEHARLHVGMTVQRAIEILEAHDLDPFRYSFICHDSWEARDAVWSDEHTLVTPAREAGDLYSFRKDDLILFMLAGLVKRLGAPSTAGAPR